MTERAWVSWSCGKDSALALAKIRADGDDVVGLVTTVVNDAEVAGSGVPVELLRRQAAALGLPVETVDLPWPCPNEVYEQRMSSAWLGMRRRGGTSRDRRPRLRCAGAGAGADIAEPDGFVHALLKPRHPVPVRLSGPAVARA
jgi:hypothetical protein